MRYFNMVLIRRWDHFFSRLLEQEIDQEEDSEHAAVWFCLGLSADN